MEEGRRTKKESMAWVRSIGQGAQQSEARPRGVALVLIALHSAAMIGEELQVRRH